MLPYGGDMSALHASQLDVSQPQSMLSLGSEQGYMRSNSPQGYLKESSLHGRPPSGRYVDIRLIVCIKFLSKKTNRKVYWTIKRKLIAPTRGVPPGYSM